MTGSRSATLFGIVLALGLLTTTPAGATWLTVTNCEIVTIDGHEYGKLTFDVMNPDHGGIDYITLRPITGPAPADTCHLVEFTLPAYWTGVRETDGRMSWWTDYTHAIPPGGALVGVQIVLSQPTCCYALRFPGPLLGDPYPEWPVCFACPGATPARESSWGLLKQTYR